MNKDKYIPPCRIAIILFLLSTFAPVIGLSNASGKEGIVTVKNEETVNKDPEYATLYIFRERDLFGMSVAYDIYLDDEKNIQLKNRNRNSS